MTGSPDPLGWATERLDVVVAAALQLHANPVARALARPALDVAVEPGRPVLAGVVTSAPLDSTTRTRVGVITSSRCSVRSVDDGDALHGGVSDRQQLHHGDTGLAEPVGIRLEDVAAGHRVTAVGHR